MVILCYANGVLPNKVLFLTDPIYMKWGIKVYISCYIHLYENTFKCVVSPLSFQRKL